MNNELANPVLSCDACSIVPGIEKTINVRKKAKIFDFEIFKQNLKNKISVKNVKKLEDALNEIFFDIRKKKIRKNIIFFSPAGASFDSFKNFEDRGEYFNQLVKKFINAKR